MIIRTADNTPRWRSHNNWKTLAIALLVLLLCANWAKEELPVFTNSQADDFFKRNYSRQKIRYDQAGEEDFLSLIRKAVLESAISNTKNYLTNTSIPAVNININFESWENIKAERSAMLGRKFLTQNRNYYKASIQHNGVTIPIKIRLKGGRTDHINRERRWSFRIKMRKGKTLFGMKSFAIQHPKTRGYQREAVFHDFARREGIVPLKYFYINVAINGEKLGVMAVEEVPAKEMLEREGYKEGLLYQLEDKNVRLLYHSVLESIVEDHPETADRIGLDAVYNLYKKDYKHYRQYRRIYRVYYNAVSAPLEEITRKKKSTDFDRQRPIAEGLFKALIAGKIKPSAVFDAEKTGRFFGYLGLWGDSHAASFRNLRYYFSPYTYKFEPVAQDSNAYSSNRIRLYPNMQNIRDHEVNRILLSDPAIMNSYLEAIKEYHTLAHSEEMVPMLRAMEKAPLRDLREEFWHLPELNLSSMKMSIDALDQSVKSGDFFKVRRELKNDREDPDPLVLPPQYRAPEVIQTRLVKTDKGHRLEVHNLFPLKTRITDLEIKINGQYSPLHLHLKQNLPISIDAFYYNEYFSHTDIELENIPESEKVSVSGTVTLDTQPDIKYPFSATRGYPYLTRHPLASMSAADINSVYPFITYLEDDNSFLIPKGNHRISDRIIFPETASVKIEAGAKLLFSESAGMLIKGNVEMIGTKDTPIILDIDEPETGKGWSGFTVMQAGSRSVLDYVEFKNTGFARAENWQITGAVTFYKSDVDIRNSKFVGTVAEDALNIVHSDFSLTDTSIEATRSDGFDADFARGSISNSRFSQIGGDGIDFSGSDIRVNDSEFDQVHDKAISVGEKTNIVIDSTLVSNSGTGLAVKDGSSAKIKNSRFDDIKYSTMMSYTKKNFYGMAELTAEDIEFDTYDFALIAQTGNRLVLDGEEIEPVKIDIEKLYKQGHMKK